MDDLATMKEPVADRSPEGEDMPPLPPGWALRDSAAFVFLACALQAPSSASINSGLQEDFEAARSELSGICLNIDPDGDKSDAAMLLASRFFESLLSAPNPGNAIALEVTRHVAELSRLGMNTTDRWLLPTINKLPIDTGTEPMINKTARDIARQVWGSAKEAVQIVESYKLISYDKVHEDMGALLQIQASAFNWVPSQELSWESSRRIVSPGFWDIVQKFISKWKSAPRQPDE